VPKKLSIEERLARLETTKPKAKQLNLPDLLFPKQLDAVADDSPFKLFLCSRRAGKSTGISADLVKTAVENEKCTSLYITAARTDAKKIVWGEVKRLNDAYLLGGVPNESELAMYFGNGSVVRLAGAKDDASVDKIRGQMPPLKKAYIDEAQSIRDKLLTRLIDDVLEPALLDYDGSLTMAGTPPPVPTGYFIRALENPNWSTHKWTFFDNPFMGHGNTHQQKLDRVLKRRGVDITDPSIRREYFGELAVDTNALVFRYDAIKNHYEKLPEGQYTYILGIDLGFSDADALAVIAWSEASKITYLVEEIVTTEQGITELVEQIERVRSKYDISKIVMDTGGLGKKISEEIIRRYRIPVEPAEKVRKFEYVELFNGAMRTQQFMAKKDSLFAADSYRVEWDMDKATPDKKVVSDRFHSDIADAVLYAWRESYSFTHVPSIPKPKHGTPEWEQEEKDRMEAEALAFFQAQEEAMKDPYRID
jgi:hypothetical protein